MAENTQSPVTIDSAQSLINLANNTQPIQQPYQYGNLGLTTSDYSLWGSKGNPYMTGGPGYNPGTRWGTPINPQPIAPIAPPSNGGGDSSPIPDWVDPSTPIYNEDGSEYDPKFDDYPWQNSKVLGDLAPGAGLAYGLINGRIDNPYGEGYARLPWYEGSAGGGYGYTEEGYDQYAPGDVDRGIYSNYYDANGNLVSERGWDDSFDDYNTGDNWANTGFWEGMGNIIGGRTWDGLEEPATFGDPASDLAKQSDAAITQAEAAKQAEKQAVAQAKLDEISKYTGMLQGEFDAQMAAQEDLNAGQIELMTQIKGDMQRDFGDFTTQNSQQMAQMAAENASMFDSIEEYRAWQLDTDAHQQSWMENQFKDQAATQNDLNSTQTDLMNQIAMDMQGTYGEFSGQMGEQLANMAAENASMFDNFAEYKQWMGESFTTLESGLNEQLAQQAAVNEGLNSNQIDLMNSIAEDMRNDYGDFESGINGQLEQMAAENASMFDSLEEYQQWMSDNNATAPATPSNPPPSTVADAVKAGKPFGKEGDDTWSPDGKNVYHGPGHNWNTPDSENKAPPGTVTPPPSSGGDDGYGDSSGGGGGWEGSDAHSDMDEDSGWSGADSDFDDSDSGGGDSGGGGGGCFIADTLVTDSTGKDKAISEYKIGDSVMSIDGKTANKVKYIEVMSWDDEYELYSPTTKLKPFITKNHPIKVEGKWVSADLDYTERNHPWIDAVDIDTPVIKKGKGIVVYNLWVDGDNTYTVNGYDTETLIGDGGVVRQGLEYGNINMEDFKNIIKSSLSSTPEVTYGMHILNMALAFITNKKANGFILDVVLGKRKFIPLDLLIYSVGKTAILLKNKDTQMNLTNKLIPQRR